MMHSLTKISQQMINQELTLDQLRGPTGTHAVRAQAAVAICTLYGKREFSFKAGELSYKQYMNSLFPQHAQKVIKQSALHGLHEQARTGYRRTVITPPHTFLAFVAKFQGTVPAAIKEMMSKCKVNLQGTPKEDDATPLSEPVAAFVDMAKEVLDEVPTRDSVLSRQDRRLHACVLHIIAQHCRPALIDKQCYSRFSFTQLTRGFFGRHYAAHNGGSLRDFSSTLGFHACTGRRLMLHPDPSFVQVVEQHPLTTLMVHNFIRDAADDLEKAKLDPDGMLTHRVSVAEQLAAIIRKHSQQQIIDALHIVRGN